jgi:hypothetical protein
MSQTNGPCKSGLLFIRPRMEEQMSVEAPLPKDFREALKWPRA